MSNSKKVLVVGWDAADWKVIHPLLDSGKMPNLNSLVEGGVMGEIGTLHPVLSPMLWTSIATGKRPFKHGIHGFVEPSPDGRGVQPVSILSRKTKAVWNILNQHEQRSLVVGWWPSHPAEPIDGVMVSNSFHKVNTIEKNQKWVMANGTVHPQSLSREIAEFRVHPAELNQDVLGTFIPKLGEIDQENDQRLWVCAKMLAEATSIQAVSTHLMASEEWDFAAVYFDAIDHFSHGFMKYHPPRQAQVSEKDFEIFQHVVRSGYIYHDMMLGSMLQLVDEDTTVIVLSDHGFHPDHLRPNQIPNEPAGPAIEHRDYGIFVMKGPGIKKDALVHGVNLLDVAPTILQLFGLPIGEDMDGRVIADAFETPPEFASVPSWDDIAGTDGQHSADRKLDPAESDQAMQQLVDLGYVEPLDDDDEVNVARADMELRYNLARSYMDADRYGDAIGLLFDLYSQATSEYRYGIQLAMCLKSLNRVDELVQLVARLRKQRVEDAKKAGAELEKYRQLALRRAEIEDPEESESYQVADAFSDGVFSPQEKKSIQMLIGLSKVNRYALDFLEGYSLAAQRKYEEATECINRAIKAKAGRPSLHILAGEVYLKTRDWEKAESSMKRALEIDPVNPHALLGLGRSQLGKRNNEEAAGTILEAIRLQFHFPAAHYFLGVALHRMNRLEKAIDALKVSITQNPNNAWAHERLGYIYKSRIADKELSIKHFALSAEAKRETKRLQTESSRFQMPEFDMDDNSAIQKYAASETNAETRMLASLRQTTPEDIENRVKRYQEKSDRPFVTIVTGLPRSGTSMMMQMLQSGGLETKTDRNRKANDDNPLGFLEFDGVKKLAEENRWVRDCNGMSLKVIAQLLQYLPKELNYRVLFMDRPMEEVLESQKVMLERNRLAGGDLTSQQLEKAFAHQLRNAVEMLKAARIPSLRVRYNAVVDNPVVAAKAIREFLEMDLDVDAMVQAVDPALYRQRIAQQPEDEVRNQS